MGKKYPWVCATNSDIGGNKGSTSINRTIQ